MTSGDRLLVFLAGLFLTATALLLGLTAGRLFPLLETGTTFVELHLYGNWQAGVAAVLLFVIGLRLVYLALARERRNQTLVQRSDLGEINISLTAIENLVQRTASQIEGVREVRSRVEARAQGIAVGIKAWVGSERNVPDLAARIQAAVRKRVQEIIGIGATEVNIAVKDIGGSEQRLKVR